MSDIEKGLYNKYRILHRESGAEVEGACFVLRPDKDAAARSALLQYAEATDNMELSADIWKWMQSIDPYAECPEGVFPLLDGTEVILSPGDRVLFHRTNSGSIPLTIDADSIIDDVLMSYGAVRLRMEALEHQLEEGQQRIGKLELYSKALEFSRDSAQKMADEISKDKGLELYEAQQNIARISSEFEPGKRKAIVEQCSDLNQYDEEDFSPPVCIEDLPEADKSEIMEWLTAILRDCAENTFDSIADALGFSGNAHE
ncbi:hypothetical protein [Paenibacillus piscarius]|uniref:hypothetical protein n=1 Tax=Paenibacillus piscarius TaxID=1089681 RepID=UPI001EE7E22D|nr:hypothetical protein [Paenibacillus piscarius]